MLAADHSNSGNPEGISKKSMGKVGSRLSWLSMLSTLCHFHGLLSRGKCWIDRYAATQCNVPHSPREDSSLVNERIGEWVLKKKVILLKTEPKSVTRNV